MRLWMWKKNIEVRAWGVVKIFLSYVDWALEDSIYR